MAHFNEKLDTLNPDWMCYIRISNVDTFNFLRNLLFFSALSFHPMRVLSLNGNQNFKISQLLIGRLKLCIKDTPLVELYTLFWIQNEDWIYLVFFLWKTLNIKQKAIVFHSFLELISNPICDLFTFQDCKHHCLLDWIDLRSSFC